MSTSIRIVPYDSRSPEEFRLIGQELRSSLGGVARRIDHIGSTSVRGLAARDVSDIQVTVRAVAAVATARCC